MKSTLITLSPQAKKLAKEALEEVTPKTMHIDIKAKNLTAISQEVTHMYYFCKHTNELINIDTLVLVTLKIENNLWYLFGKSVGSLVPDVKLSKGFKEMEDARSEMAELYKSISERSAIDADKPEGPRNVKRKAK